MLVPSRPKSNAERQREFRKRNPGYYTRLHARRYITSAQALETLRAMDLARIEAEAATAAGTETAAENITVSPAAETWSMPAPEGL